MKIHLRSMTREDLAACMDLKKAANWNQLEQDWEMLLESGTVNLVAEYQGKLVGSITSINYEGRFSWIGMVLVDPAHRNLGIGTRLLKAGIEGLRGYGAIRLDATPKGKKLYRSLGFKEEYGLLRLERLQSQGSKSLPAPESICMPMREDDLEAVAGFDKIIFGANRKVILGYLLAAGPKYAWIAKSGEEITGYCLGRPGSDFEQIGPVVSRSDAVARSLLLYVLNECRTKSVIVDSLIDHSAWSDLLMGLGFVHQRPFTRMCLGEHRYPGEPVYQYAIAGPEIG